MRSSIDSLLTHGVLWALIPGMVLLDSTTGLLQAGGGVGVAGSPGQLARGALLAVSLLALVVVKGFAVLRVYVVVLWLLGLAGIVFGLLDGEGRLTFDLLMVSRELYGPSVALLFALIIWRGGFSARQVFSYVSLYGAGAGAIILVLALAGVGLYSYGDYSEASSGFFSASNDIGLAMLIGLSPAFYLFVVERSVSHGLMSLVIVAGLLVLGTRTGLLGSILVPGSVLVFVAPIVFSRRRWVTASVVGAICVIGVTAVTAFQIQRMQRDPYNAARFAMLLSADYGRVSLMRDATESLANRSVTELLLGRGASAHRWPGPGRPGDPEADLLAEVDWIDIAGTQGIIYAILIHGFYLLVLVHPRRARGNLYNVPIGVAIVVFLGHSALAGHALTSPTAAGALAPLLALSFVFVRRKRSCGPQPLDLATV